MTPENGLDIGFVGSTGRTATSLIAKTLAKLDGVLGLHEGHYLHDKKTPIIPSINMEQRKCWYDQQFRQSLVRDKRSAETIRSVTSEADKSHFIDVAYYNAPLVRELYDLHPEARILVLFRRCEPFVRSATTLHGEDDMPVGWPAVDKALTPREKFIELGRLKPQKGTPDAECWDTWSAIERNIWLWRVTNQYLWEFVESASDERVSFLHFEMLAEDPEQFWEKLLSSLGLLSKENLAACVAGSKRKENAKMGGYQIGQSDDWSAAEKDAFRQALLLENSIYE